MQGNLYPFLVLMNKVVFIILWILN